MDANSVEAIILRLKEVLHARTDTELADKLGLSKQSISSARRNNRVPESWLSKATESTGASIEWLKWGVGVAAIGGAALASPPLLAGAAVAGGAIGLIGGLISKAVSFVGSDSKDILETTKNFEQVISQLEAFYAARIAELEKKLKFIENERRDLSIENRELWRKISELQEQLRDQSTKPNEK